MGLDMYLIGYNSKNDLHGASIAYWRKANAIHWWFVQNVQNGIDDCREYVVTKAQLKELYDICAKIQPFIIYGESPFMYEANLYNALGLTEDGIAIARELLPTQGGFFFGGVGYVASYAEAILTTMEQLISVIANMEAEPNIVVKYLAS